VVLPFFQVGRQQLQCLATSQGSSCTCGLSPAGGVCVVLVWLLQGVQARAHAAVLDV
jgi:hypothetical protein